MLNIYHIFYVHAFISVNILFKNDSIYYTPLQCYQINLIDSVITQKGGGFFMNPAFLFSNLPEALFPAKILNMNIIIKG